MNERHWTWLICILTAAVVVLAWPRVPAPENELLIQVYRDADGILRERRACPDRLRV